MSDINRQQGAMQGRRKGLCRQDGSGAQFGQGMCRGFGNSTGKQTSMPPAESVISSSKEYCKANLQSLKEQADRMIKALKEIERQIKTYE